MKNGKFKDFQYIFYPRSIAVVGASTDRSKSGTRYLDALINSGFKGDLYPVNPGGGEILGLKAYKNLTLIPGIVDYVIISVPSRFIPTLLDDAATKGVKAVQMFTAGFSETNEKEGIELENKIVEKAKNGGFRIVGPNCIGVYSPAHRVPYGMKYIPADAGSVAFISHSGGVAGSLVTDGISRGIRFSKVVSYGNACDINESDLLEYFAADADTKIIIAYIEGVRDGKRFAQVLSKCAKTKPVIVFKGGITEGGARAAVSHTGALAGGALVWDRLLYQAGAIRVSSLDELVDMAVTFTYLPLPLGKKAGILGVGGGATVLATDDCISAGLMVPRFSRKIQGKLRDNLPKGNVGVGLSNPVDLSDQLWGVLYNCAKTILGYEEIDMLIYHLHLGGWAPFAPDKHTAALISSATEVIRAHHESSKPMAVIIHGANSRYSQEVAFKLEQVYCQAGLPVYLSQSSAAKAIIRFIDYHERVRPNSLSS